MWLFLWRFALSGLHLQAAASHEEARRGEPRAEPGVVKEDEDEREAESERCPAGVACRSVFDFTAALVASKQTWHNKSFYPPLTVAV
jgi:hypothetical protein